MVAGDISRRLLRCTVRIDTAVGGGTGFITSCSRGNESGLFLVTNRHVMTDADHMRLAFLTSAAGQNPRVHKKALVDIPNVQDNCVFHEDPEVDIAVLPFGGIADEYSKNGTPLLYSAIAPDLYLTESRSREMSAIEEVIIIGYPLLLRDEQTLTPIVRRGITATPIDQGFHGMRGSLVDASIFEGSSGSPVFVYNAGPYSIPNGIVMGSRLVFLGILAKLVSGLGHSPSTNRQNSVGASDPGNATDAGDPDAAMGKYTNLGLVFSAQCVHEAVVRMMVERSA